MPSHRDRDKARRGCKILRPENRVMRQLSRHLEHAMGFWSFYRLGELIQAIRNCSCYKTLEHFPDHKSPQLSWKIL
jgi:hypothetical protein